MNANILLQRVLKKFEDDEASGNYVCHTLAIVVKEHIQARMSDEYGLHNGDWIVIIEAAAKLHAAVQSAVTLPNGEVATFGVRFAREARLRNPDTDITVSYTFKYARSLRLQWLRASLECDHSYTANTGMPLIDWQKADKD